MRNSWSSRYESRNMIEKDKAICYGYELLLLVQLQKDPFSCIRILNPELTAADSIDTWKATVLQKLSQDDFRLECIPFNLWYLAIALDRQKSRLVGFLRNGCDETTCTLGSRPLVLCYLNYHAFTELHLDTIFKYGDDNTLPTEIFQCASVRLLSLKYNYLELLPPSIGMMKNLQCLLLTNNKLQNKSLPHTLTFCTKLETLYLDNNLLDALPGFLLKMKSLVTVYRHGNHNYFKSTFMWYHTDVNERILVVRGLNEPGRHDPKRLQFWAAKSILGCGLDFFEDARVPPALKSYIAAVYSQFFICGHCGRAGLVTQSVYKVITFKNPYLGNSCVPFQHVACSIKCARAIEIPARREQIKTARRLDKQYAQYVSECEGQASSVAQLSSRRKSEATSRTRLRLSRFRRSGSSSNAERLQSGVQAGSHTSADSGASRRSRHGPSSNVHASCVIL